jgi:acyl-homoserine lactone acylase PvdQ
METAVTVAYRQVIDMGNFSNATAMYAPGQSGHVGNPHYGNFVERWLKGEYFRMDWTEVERTAVVRHRLMLVGKG